MNYIGIYSGAAVKCFMLGKAKMREYNDEKEGGSLARKSRHCHSDVQVRVERVEGGEVINLMWRL